jgi:hypothetical protein
MYKLLKLSLTSVGTAVFVTLGMLSAQAGASDVVELRDGNSVLRTDLLKFNIDEAWFVDGNNVLFTDLYFFNVGTNPAQRELRLEDLDNISLQRPADNRLTLTGQKSVFGANLNFSLDSALYGGEMGSYQSRREDVLQVSYTGSAPLEFSLYKYIDFDLEADDQFDNDILSFEENTLTQTDDSGLEASLITPDREPSGVAFAEYPILISQLYDDRRTNLPPTTGPLVGTDGTAALQFDQLLEPGETLTFRFVKQVQKKTTSIAVPEPSILLALGVVVGGLATLRRKS